MEPKIEQLLARARKTVYLNDLLALLARLLFWAGTALLLAVVLDHALFPGPGVCWGAFGIVVMVPLSVLVWQLCYRADRKMNPAYLAQQIERAHPVLLNDLTTYLRHPTPALAAQILAHCGADTTQIRVRVPKDAVRSTWGLALVICWLGYGLGTLHPVGHSVARIVSPWRAQALGPPSQTRLVQVTPADGTFLSIEDVWYVELETAGHAPTKGHVRWRHEQGEWRNTPVEHREDGSYGAKMPRLIGTISFICYLGDATSAPHTVQTIATPIIEQQLVRYELPPYLEQAARTDRAYEISGVVGSRVHFEIRTDPPLASAELVWLGKKEQLKRSERVVSTFQSKLLTHTGDYFFRLYPHPAVPSHRNPAIRCAGLSGPATSGTADQPHQSSIPAREWTAGGSLRDPR